MSFIHHHSYVRRRGLALGVSLAALAFAAPALAQDDAQPADAAAEDGAEGRAPEIVVTAQFREQRLQDIPIAITAIDDALLEARSQTNLQEVTNQAPNVTLRTMGASFGPSMGASIRGVGQFDFSPAFEPGVGLYIDDVYYSSLTGANFELLDLERIEILRGPQGTLAGRNSIGGAIRMISKRPDSNTGGFVEATYGSRNHIGVRASADFVIDEANGLYARISGVARQQEGYVKRYDYGCLFPASGIATTRGAGECLVSKHGGVGYTGIRGQLRWNPSSSVDILLAGDYTKDNRTNSAEVLAATGVVGNPINIGPQMSNAFICGRYCNYAQYSQPAITWAGPFAAGIPLVATSGTDIANYEGWGVSLNADFDLTDKLQLTSISAYRAWNNSFNTDDDLSPSNIGFGQNALDFWFWSQEVRLNAELMDTLNVTVGGYTSDQRTEYFTYQDLRYIVIPLQFIYFPGHDPVNADNWALFGTAIWNPIEPLTITAGLRYTDEHKDYTYFRANPDGTPNPFLGAINGTVGVYDGTRWDYRLSADYRLSPEFMVYATTATGFKGGGVNPRPFTPGQARGFNPEVLTSYELGFKADLLDRRVRLNAAAFLSKYDDLQIAVLSCPQFDPPGTPPQPCAAPQNAGNAEIKGFEAETFITPVDGLQIDGSLSYIHFKYKCINILTVRPLNPGEVDTCSSDPAVVSLIGTPGQLPKWKWSWGAQYEFQVPGGTLTPRFDMSYTASTSGGASVTAIPLPAITLANARITWQNQEEDWKVALEVTNLFEEYYYLTTFDLRGAGAGFAKAAPGRPREWAVTVTKRF
jgi:iron complex outermembrane receptor protein